MEEASSGGSPDKGHDAFGNHGSVEYGTSMALARHAACHQRALRGMKTADSPARDTDKHNGKYRQRRSVGMGILQSVPYFRQCRMLHVEHNQNAHRHKQQRNGKQRIYLADNLIHRQQGGKYIIDKDHHNPENGVQRFRRQAGKQSGRTCHKHGSHKYHQDNGKSAHHLLGSHAQITAYNLRQALAPVAQRKHSCKIVVHRPGKNTTEHYPQIGCRTEFRSHDCTEDRSQACDIQELYHKDFPRRQRDIVHPVGFGNSRSLAVVRSEYVFYKASVDEITCNQRQQAERKCNHGVLMFNIQQVLIMYFMYANVTVSN